jgi:3-isopropylmalate/(R)-2-methylmalate dehydratase small subunit
VDKFTTLTAIAAPYLRPNVDTDLIIRVERCTRTPREELGQWAFEMVRYRADGSEDPEFVFNRAPWRDARILVAGENFGCGSSREMAVWALKAMGLRCIIGPSYGEIFFGNCFQNGILPVRLPRATVDHLAESILADPAKSTLTVDLERQEVVFAGETIAFAIDARRKRMLLEGLDEIGLTLARDAEIASFQAADRLRRPWIYP